MALHQMSTYRSEALGRGLTRSPVGQERVSERGSEASPGTARGRVLETHRAPWALPRGCSGVLGPSFHARCLLSPCSMPDPALGVLGVLGAGQTGERALRVASPATGPALPPEKLSSNAGQENRRQGPARAAGQNVRERVGRTWAGAGGVQRA